MFVSVAMGSALVGLCTGLFIMGLQWGLHEMRLVKTEMRLLQLKQDEHNIIAADAGILKSGDLYYGRATNKIKSRERKKK